jgi:site-specific DNA-methyltransferase (adenine-specific)
MMISAGDQGRFAFLQGDAHKLPLEERSVDLVLCSPPYEDSRPYGSLGFKLRGQKWVDWMKPRVREACRVSKGLACFVMAGTMRSFQYQPVVEWLVADLTRFHGIVLGPAPYCYHRSGTCGKQRYHRRDWEPVYCFAYPERLPPWSDPLAMGKPPKFRPGGDMTNRRRDGKRTEAGSDGKKRYTPPEIANPGNVIHCKVGKGHMGNDLAHEGEAPFPESLCDFLIRTYCPPGGVVLDPFSGTGTTVAAACKAGRNGIGLDVVEEYCRLGLARLCGITLADWRRGQRPLFPDHNPVLQ